MSIDIDMSAVCAFIVCVAALATTSWADAVLDPPRTSAALTPPATNKRAAAPMPNALRRRCRSRPAAWAGTTVGDAHEAGPPEGWVTTGRTGAPSGA